MADPVIFKMSAKVNDLFYAKLLSIAMTKLAEYDGYVPDFFPDGGGDYISLDIDINTGKILNWKSPSKAALNRTFGKAVAFAPVAIEISGKCSDMFTASLEYKGHKIGKNYNYYVPDFFPGQHWGDYVILAIDLKTGKILNWRKPTKRDIKELFGDVLK